MIRYTIELEREFKAGGRAHQLLGSAVFDGDKTTITVRIPTTTTSIFEGAAIACADTECIDLASAIRNLYYDLENRMEAVQVNFKDERQ